MYSIESPYNANQSFCSGGGGSSSTIPYQLVAKSPITKLKQPTGSRLRSLGPGPSLKRTSYSDGVVMLPVKGL